MVNNIQSSWKDSKETICAMNTPISIIYEDKDGKRHKLSKIVYGSSTLKFYREAQYVVLKEVWPFLRKYLIYISNGCWQIKNLLAVIFVMNC